MTNARGTVFGMTMALALAAATGCALKAEEKGPDAGGTSTGAGSSGTSGSPSGSGSGSPSGNMAGGGDAGATAGADGTFKVGDAFDVVINSKQPEVDVPTYGKERGHKFFIDLASDKATTITLCPADATTDTPSNLYIHPEGDEKAIQYGAQRPGYGYQGSSLANLRPQQSGRFVVYASNAVGQLRDTGGVYVLKAAFSTADNDACPR